MVKTMSPDLPTSRRLIWELISGKPEPEHLRNPKKKKCTFIETPFLSLSYSLPFLLFNGLVWTTTWEQRTLRRAFLTEPLLPSASCLHSRVRKAEWVWLRLPQNLRWQYGEEDKQTKSQKNTMGLPKFGLPHWGLQLTYIWAWFT